MKTESAKRCPKCSAAITQVISAHLEPAGDCPYAKMIIRQTEKVISYVDGTFICMRCLEYFENQGRWNSHQKKIRQVCLGFKEQVVNLSTPQKEKMEMENIMVDSNKKIDSTQLDSKNLNASASSFFYRRQEPSLRFINSSLFSEEIHNKEGIKITKELSKTQETALHLLDILVAQSKLHIVEWVANNSQIKKIYLQQFFIKFIDKFLKGLTQQIKEVSFQELNKQFKADWKKIINEPSDIFDQSQILNNTKLLPPTTKIKILKALNRIYQAKYQGIIPKFPISYTPSAHRELPPLKTSDLFWIIEQLFATKKRSLVHIAIDFYLIFQSGQRSESDRQNIEKGIAELMQKRKNQSGFCQLELAVNKVSRFSFKKSKFVLSEQLCKLLEAFKWTGFFKKGALYRRMFSIFGFPAYSIKKCLFSQMKLQQHQYPKLQLKQLADHKQQRTSMVYAKGGEVGRIKMLKDLLKVPNLTIQFITRQQFLSIIGQYPNYLSCMKIKKDWLRLLKRKLASQEIEEINFYNFNSKDAIFGMIEESNNQENHFPVEIEEKLEGQRENQSKIQSSQSKIISQEVAILSNTYTMLNGKFNLSDLFFDGQVSYCLICNLHEDQQNNHFFGKQCSFCTAQYHTDCQPKFCSCLEQENQQKQGLSYQKKSLQKHSLLNLFMPDSYFNVKSQELNQIKFLLAARGFYYTPVSIVLNPSYLRRAQQSVNTFKLEKMILPRYAQYEQGLYFPPLQLKVSGNQTASGTGFGLFAAENISQKCFIGQYAADILTEQQSIQIKRPDSIMTLVNGSRPFSKIIIGPVKRCGYVCLINGSSSKEANCSVVTVEINGQIRIILYTNKKITKGSQLYYNYDKASNFRASTLRKERKIVQVSENSSSALNLQIEKKGYKTNLEKRCGLANLGNTCYMNAVFQFIKLILQQKLQESPSTEIQYVLSGLMSKMNNNIRIAPTQQVNAIKFLSDFAFGTGVQQDAHEFLGYLLNNLREEVKKQLTIKQKNEWICECGHKSSNIEKSLIYHLEYTRKNFGKNALLESKKENLTDYQCQSCKQKGKTNLLTAIESFPCTLIVSIKRFSNDLKKVDSFFNNISIGSNMYQLIVIISHQGPSLLGGHYRTFQVINNNRMIVYDDDTVKIEPYSYKEAYILGYKKLKK